MGVAAQIDTYLKNKVTNPGVWSASLESGVDRPALLEPLAVVRVSALLKSVAQSFK